MKFSWASILLIGTTLFAGHVITAQQPASPISASASVEAGDLLARPVGENWTSYNGDYTGRRYSALREINVGNVAQLRAAWVFHPGNSQNLEVTPLVVRGIMFVTSSNNVFALDARTGRTVWHYQRPVSSGLLDDAAAHKNRGVAVWRDSVYAETDDAHLLCLDARSGGLRWDIEFADKTKRVWCDQRAAGGERFGNCGHIRRRFWSSRLHCCVRRGHRKVEVAFLDHSRAGRIRFLQLARRFVFAWRRHNLDARHLRSGAQHSVLDNQ